MKSPSSRLEDLYADTGGAYHFGIESQVTEEEVFKAENDESLNSEPQSVQYCHHRSSSSTSTSNHHRPPHPTYTAAATNGNASPLPGSAPISSFHRHQTPPHGGGYMIHPPPPPPGPPHAMSHMNHAPPHQHQPHPLVSIHPSASMEDVHEAVALHAAASRDGGGGGSSPDTIPTRPSSALSNSSKQKRKKSMAIPEDCSSDPAPVSVPGSGSVPAIQYASYPPPPPHHFAPYPYYPPPPYAIPVYYPAGMPPPGPPHAPRHPHHHYPSAFPSVSSDFSRDEQPHSSTTPTQETNRTKHKEEAVENVERDEQHQQHHQHHQHQHPPGHENEESAYNALKLSKSKSFEQRQKDNMIRAKLKEISQKPQNQKTPQDLVFFKKYEYKRQRKNERGRARTREDKKRMERIEAINPHLRSKEDAEWYDAKMLAKRRKNLMDRQRRQRLKINKTNSMTSTSSSTYGGGQQNEDSANDIAPQVIQYSNTYTSVESNGNGDEQSLSHLESYNSMGGGDGDDESSVCPKMMLSFLETLNKVNEPEHHGTDIGVGSPTRATNAATMAAAATAASTTTTSNSKWDNQQQQSRDTSRSSIFRNLH